MPSKTQDKPGTMNGRMLNVEQDLPDLRDRYYTPALLDLKISMMPPSPSKSPILDQGREGACTGFALASAINLQNNLRQAQISSRSVFSALPDRASPRMLYEMARLNDEWLGEDYSGSSIRGALKGFYHNGVCDESLAPYRVDEKNWHLTREQAKNARTTGLGAYFRLHPSINDYHAALNETGVVYVSAKVHRGWQNPKKGIIKKSNVHTGGHAFIIVGYNDKGFLIQNSWGADWGGYNGHGGIAQWAYDDWAENIMDAWVLRLSVPTPDYFDVTHNASPGSQAALQGASPAPRREEIHGHFIHLDDGELVTTGSYATPAESIEETGRLFVTDSERDEPHYDHLLFYMHGGLNDSTASARRIRQMKGIFKRNRIYPIHFMWETGGKDEFIDALLGFFNKAEGRVGGIADWKDIFIEKMSRPLGRALWGEMKRDAERAFQSSAGGTQAARILLNANAKRKKPMKVHFVAHSAGSILLARFLLAKQMIASDLTVETVSLMAPACTIGLFEEAYVSRIGQTGGIKSLVQYNLTDERELDDHVAKIYRKSLLYLVSRAFEEYSANEKVKPLLGMEKYAENLALRPEHTLYYAGRDNKFTDAMSHGGFDNDRATMNHVLKTILGKKPKRKLAFQEEELVGY